MSTNNFSTSNKAIGVSREVIDHHYTLHRRACVLLAERCATCECGGTVVISCASCDHALFIAHPTWPPCEHAENCSGTWEETTCEQVAA